MVALTLTSTSFSHNDEIPARHTCDDRDVSPELSWTKIPDGTRSLVLIVDDPDAPDPAAPKMTWVHWMLYNIPPDASSLPEGVGAKDLPPGTLQGLNDWQRTGCLYSLTEAKFKALKAEKPEDRFLANYGKQHIQGTTCPGHACGGQMRLRQGKNGEFLGCSNFPKCKVTRDQ